MATTAAIASIVAAVTGIIALALAWRDTQQRRIVELLDLVTDVKAAIDWGSEAALRRDELQGRLRSRLGRLDLPYTRALATQQLRSESPFSEMAALAVGPKQVGSAGRWLVAEG